MSVIAWSLWEETGVPGVKKNLSNLGVHVSVSNTDMGYQTWVAAIVGSLCTWVPEGNPSVHLKYWRRVSNLSCRHCWVFVYLSTWRKPKCPSQILTSGIKLRLPPLLGLCVPEYLKETQVSISTADIGYQTKVAAIAWSLCIWVPEGNPSVHLNCWRRVSNLGSRDCLIFVYLSTWRKPKCPSQILTSGIKLR